MEEITISLEARIILGKLIRVYQKEHKMTLNQLIDGICSKQVATNMGKGIISKNDDNYLEMLSKFGLSYNYYHNLDEDIAMWSMRLKEAVEWYDFKKVEKICDEAMKKLKNYKGYALEYEAYLAFKMVRKYYVVSQEIEKESDHFLKVKWMLNTDLCDVVKCVVFKYYYRYHGFGDKNNLTTQHVREEIELSESEYPPLLLLEVLCLIIDHKGYDAFKVLNYLEEYFENTRNYNGLLDTYGKVVYLIKTIQTQSLDEYADKVDKIIEEHREELDSERVAIISLNLGKYYINDQRYEKAIKYFRQTLLYPHLFRESSVCLNYIKYKTNECVSEELFLMPEGASSDVIVEMMYTYYYLKSKGADKNHLRLYLSHEILKKISKEHFYYHIAIDELEMIK